MKERKEEPFTIKTTDILKNDIESVKTRLKVVEELQLGEIRMNTKLLIYIIALYIITVAIFTYLFIIIF